VLKVSFLCPFPIIIITVLSVVSVNSNGDGLLLVMDTAFMTFVVKVKVFLVLMRVAVVDVVDDGVVGDIDVVDDGVVGD